MDLLKEVLSIIRQNLISYIQIVTFSLLIPIGRILKESLLLCEAQALLKDPLSIITYKYIYEENDYFIQFFDIMKIIKIFIIILLLSLT